jgi:hypothetical protein
LSVLLALLLMGAAWMGSVADAAILSFQPAFSPSEFLGEGSTLNAQFTFTGSEYHGSPDPATEVVVHLPAGVGGTSAGFPTCSESTLYESGTAGCPAGSLAGPVGSIGLDIESGGVVTERVHETGTIQPVFADKENTNDDFFFYIEAPGVQAVAPAHYVEDTPPYGRALMLEVPLIESIPAQPFASITSLTLTLGASREEDAQLISSLTIPQECPGSGMFPWAADVTYTTNASFTEQTHEHTTAETVCPPPSGKSATTTTLQVSPASPHVGEVVNYTATVTPKTLGATVPSGSVTFLDEGIPIVGCTVQALIPGPGVSSASCQLSYPINGTHQVTARYGGDSGYFGSESPVQTITVSAAEPPHEEPRPTEAPKPPPVAQPPLITGAQLKAMLSRQLVPAGVGARIGALLKSGGHTFSFNVPEAGNLMIQWYELPKGAKLAKKVKVKPVLVASGKASFAAAGTGKVAIRLTAQGKRLLKHTRRILLEAKAGFVAGGGTVNITRWFALRR